MVKGDRMPCCGIPAHAGKGRADNGGHHRNISDHETWCTYRKKIERKRKHRGAAFPLGE
jgi:hypothetical protein